MAGRTICARLEDVSTNQWSKWQRKRFPPRIFETERLTFSYLFLDSAVSEVSKHASRLRTSVLLLYIVWGDGWRGGRGFM
mmetsp:Transcript_6429/g.12115  ORF Transcript_6429/g.12115 Transcript_6429/m.12115 type:complete len:80 (-) Transcript_6429:81-320(-)